MVQRLGLAGALVGDPQLLILDEPTSALDPAGRADILNLVAAMRGRRTVIFSSHILADVQRIADRVGILRAGRLLYQGATGDLIDTYLRPAWLVRIAGQAAPVAASIRAQTWATRVELAATDAIRIDATTIEAGERGIPAAIAACGARQVSCAAGILCGSVYLAFAVAVTGAAASVARSTLATVGLAVAALLLPLVGTFRSVHDWLPSTLVTAPVDLLTGSHLSHFLPALGVTVAAGALALAVALNRLRAREI